MTREESIAILQSMIPTPCRADGKSTTHTLVTIALYMAIKALEQQPCEDTISRQAVMDCFKKWQPYMATRLFEFEKELSALPSITPQPERKTGKWIWNKRTGEYECSECGCNPIYEGIAFDYSEIDKYRYCRWCGAPMEGSE